MERKNRGNFNRSKADHYRELSLAYAENPGFKAKNKSDRKKEKIANCLNLNKELDKQMQIAIEKNK